jgi:molybdate transport system substrate-binding protein
MAQALHLLCAGAAFGLVKALEPRFLAESGVRIEGHFGAVGAMREALEAGEPCDLIVLTDALIDTLTTAEALRAGTRAPLGRVRTGVAVRGGTPHPDVATPEALRSALRAANAIYFPDPVRATAGIHFVSVLRHLGIHDELAPRFRCFPNGATAMRELAAATSPRPIGCTQVTEILYTEGVELTALLPPQFELATLYTAAIAQRAARPELASRFIALLTGADTQPLRADAGFEA